MGGQNGFGFSENTVPKKLHLDYFIKHEAVPDEV
jgi:hypothetical protein